MPLLLQGGNIFTDGSDLLGEKRPDQVRSRLGLFNGPRCGCIGSRVLEG
jgi:hypothetical protein